MRTGILGSIAATVLGASTAWGQSSLPSPAAVAPSTIGSQFQQIEAWSPHSAPPGVVLPGMPGVPPGGPPIDAPFEGGMAPQPPVPMYPPPGPYTAPMFQSTPPQPGASHNVGSGTAPHFWSSFEYLLYFPKSQNVPFSLLTSSAPNDDGRIGRGSTLNLVPAGDYTYNLASGFRATIGAFGDDDRRYGVEASGFALEQKSNIQTFSSQAGGIPLLARPFVDSTTFDSSSAIIADLFYGSGSAVFRTSTQTWGTEASGVLNLYRSCPDSTCQISIDAIAGYRYLQLTEELSITSLSDISRTPSTINRFDADPNNMDQALPTTPGGLIPGAFRSFLIIPVVDVGGTRITTPGAIAIQDSFTVKNRFNGGQVGLRSFTRYGMFSLLLSGKVALGSMRQTVDISGATGIYDGIRGFTGGSYGGVLANASNIGRYTNEDYAVIPEFNAAVGVNLTRNLTVSMGYNLLYIDNVVRPGTLVNPVVNRAQIPASSTYGSANTIPTFTELFKTQEFFLHGANFSMTFKY